MTAKEALQALLDGKMLRKGEVTIIPMEWGFQMQADNGVYKDIILRDCEVVEEYPLTYAQAWEAMLAGKIVMCEANERFAFRFRNGVLEHSCQDDEFTMWENGVALMDMNGSKWKVVE